jgi:hypothetical protein
MRSVIIRDALGADIQKNFDHRHSPFDLDDSQVRVLLYQIREIRADQ